MRHPVSAGVRAPARRLPSWLVFVVSFVMLFAMSALWAIATPVFAAPDEDAHAFKAIAIVRGDVLGHVVGDSKFPVYELPESYRFPANMLCFARNADQPADCGAELGDANGSSTFDDWVSTYNPVYYVAVGWPSLLFGGATGIYAMRLVSAAVCCLLLAAATAIGLGARRARWLPAALAFLASPMILFLNGSISPQGTEIAGGVLLTIALIRVIQRVDEPGDVTVPKGLLWTAVAVGAVELALARALGPLWIVILVAGVFTVMGWRRSLRLFRRPLHYIPIGVVVLAGLFSVIWTLYTGTLSGQAQANDAPLVGGSFLDGAWSMLRSTPYFLESAAGVFGWQDTELPPLVYALYFGAVAVVLTIAFAAVSRRDRLLFIGALAAALLVPVVVQATSVSRTGIIWQGRYALFLYLAVILVAAVMLSRSAEGVAAIAGRVSAVVAALIAVYGVGAFAAALRRYIVGEGGSVTDMIHAPAWQPPLGWPALVALMAVASVVMLVWNLLLVRSATRSETPAPVHA